MKKLLYILVMLTVLSSSNVLCAIKLQVIDSGGSPVEHAVVTVESNAAIALKLLQEEVVIEQRRQQFHPRVAVIPLNAKVRFPNRDITQHHVYSFSRPKQFEIELYGGDEPGLVLFDKAGIVALACNIHDWMLGYIYVTGDPHFGTTDASGHLSLAVNRNDIVQLTVWHPALSNGAPLVIPTADLQEKSPSQLTIELDLDANDPLLVVEDELQDLFERPQ